MFKQKRKILEHEIKNKLIRKTLCPIPSVKYPGVKIHENLNWHQYTNDLAAKLHRANVFLFKIRNYVNQKILRSIYFAIFDSHSTMLILYELKILMRFNKFLSYKKAIRIISFQHQNSHSSSFFYQ